MKIVIIGAPGSGKGTQAGILAKELRLKHIVASEIIRKETRKNNSIRKIIERGDLLPEKIIEPIMRKHIPKDNFIIDGYPRKISQAKLLEKINKPDIVLVLDAPSTILKKRLLKNTVLTNKRVRGFSNSRTWRFFAMFAKNSPTSPIGGSLVFFTALPKKKASRCLKAIS